MAAMQCILRIVANPKYQYHNSSGRARLDISDLSGTDHDLAFKGEPWASFGKPELKSITVENGRVVVEASHKIEVVMLLTRKYIKAGWYEEPLPE